MMKLSIFCEEYNDESLARYNEKFKDMTYWQQIGNCRIINEEIGIPENIKLLVSSVEFSYSGEWYTAKSTLCNSKDEIYPVLQNCNTLFMVLELLDFTPSKYLIRWCDVNLDLMSELPTDQILHKPKPYHVTSYPKIELGKPYSDGSHTVIPQVIGEMVFNDISSSSVSYQRLYDDVIETRAISDFCKLFSRKY